MKNLPQSFLFLTHEGLHKAQISIDPVLDIDKLLAQFSTERLLVITGITEHSFGTQHLALWTSEPPRVMPILELTRGLLTLSTIYHSVTVTIDEEEPKLTTSTWVSPCFSPVEKSFSLRCAFDFKLWADAGLRLFLGLNLVGHQIYFWVYYDGQIYRPPLGNIFDTTAQLCLGKNEAAHKAIFTQARADQGGAFTKALQLMSDSTWNADTFHHDYIPILNSLIRFDPDHNLPMLPPLEPALIKGCSVVTNKDLIQVTAKLILPII